jgi:hypothetical protein
LSAPARFASIWKLTFAVCDSVKLICAWPVEVSAGVAKFWFAPLFGHSIALPPEAAESLTTAKGENRLWLERFSSSTTSEVPPPELLLDEDEELLEDELLELDELELLLDEELELELEDELLEDDEEELLLEDEEDVLLPPAILISTSLACASWKAL